MHPRLNINEIGAERLDECIAELRLAKTFLKSGLLRSAMVKAVQSWRAYLSYMAAANSDLIDVRGVKRVGGVSIRAGELAIATMPIRLMMNISNALKDKDPELVELTELALVIYEYCCTKQHPGGLDKITDEAIIRGITAKLISKIERKINGLIPRGPCSEP